MKHVGLLTVRNEVDVIDEFLDDVEKYFDTVFVMDDSNDGTYERLLARPVVKYLIRYREVYDPKGQRTDGQKQFLFERIQEYWGEGTWITILNADAFFGDDPNRVIEKAEEEGATAVPWTTYNFFPHNEDIPRYNEDKVAWLASPVQERLTWVQDHKWTEALQFKVSMGYYYNVNRHHRIIPENFDGVVSQLRPILLHYPLRSPWQVVARMKDRLETGFRNANYYKHWVANGGFATKQHPVFPQMKPWNEMGVKLFSI